MAIQKKSLVSSRPAQAKTTAARTTKATAIGEAKGLKANALSRRNALRHSGAAIIRTMKAK